MRGKICPDANHRLEGILDGYAAREYGDLIRSFYRPRWEKFLDMVTISLESGEEYKEYNFFDFNGLFCYGSIDDAERGEECVVTARKIIHEIKRETDGLNI